MVFGHSYYEILVTGLKCHEFNIICGQSWIQCEGRNSPSRAFSVDGKILWQNRHYLVYVCCRCMVQVSHAQSNNTREQKWLVIAHYKISFCTQSTLRSRNLTTKKTKNVSCILLYWCFLAFFNSWCLFYSLQFGNPHVEKGWKGRVWCWGLGLQLRISIYA